MFGKMDKHRLTAKKSSFIRLRMQELYSIVMILDIFFCSFCGAQNVVSACSNTDIGQCNFFNFSCSEARDKIQIIFAKYRIRRMSAQSMTSQRHNRAAVPAEYQRRCPLPPNVCTSPLACCRNPQNYEDKPYSAGHLYSLLDQCSYRDNCEAKAQYNTPYKATSISCSVSYRCVAEAKVVKFCQEYTLTATEIHIVFENTMLENTTFENNIKSDTFWRASNAMCWCVLRSPEKYTVRAQDFRFQNGTGHCTQSSSLSGFLPNENISCSRHKNIDERLREEVQNVSGEKTFELNVDLTNKPQMVWIEAKGTEQLTAECFSANRWPTTATASLSPSQKTSTTSGTTPTSSVSSTTSISFSTTVTSKANDTTLTVQTSNADDTTLTTEQSSSKQPNTTENSNYERTTEKQTAPSKNNSSERHIRDGESGGIPVPAIVVPTVVIVLLLGVGAFVLFWRKRRVKGETTKEARDFNIIAENPTLNKTCNNAYNKPLETSGETHDYLELQPEHTYTYIDHGEVKSNGLPNIAQTFPKQAQDVNEHSENNYFILEPEAGPLPSKAFGNDKSNMGNTALTETASENHNYFVLEPQQTISADVSEAIPTAIQTSHSDEGNYFILEPQRIVDTQSEPQEMSNETNVERTATENLQNPEYFILESGDTYDNIHPDDVTVQSLPENEYNSISLNANRIIRDPNYDALKDARNCRNIEDNGEYSHIQNTLVNTFNKQENYYGEVASLP